MLKNKKVDLQKQWLMARKELLNHIKEQVQYRFGEVDKHVLSYQKEYDKEFLGAWKSTNFEQLYVQIQKADIVLGADFHAFSQSQRTHLRVLRDMPQQLPVVLALECFEPKDNVYIAKYLAGKMAESEFLKKVRWDSSWGFPWAHYKPLLALCRKMKIPVFGVNKAFKSRSIKTIHSRDKYSSREILKIKQQFPKSLVYVVYGDYHLAADHLPLALESLSSKKLNILRIFQNSEKLYFRLAKQEATHKVDVLKRNGSTFCILSSPPWVKWQSYQMYLDQYIDQDLDEEGEVVEYTDYVATLIKFVSKDLGLQVKSQSLEVYSSFQEDSWKIFKKDLSSLEKAWIKYHIKSDRSFLLPGHSFLYLSSPTINHASALAGYYLQSQLSGNSVKVNILLERFLPLIWIEACSFFISKLINHKRKSEKLEQIQAHLAISSPKDKGREAFMIALEQRFREIAFCLGRDFGEFKYIPRSSFSYFEASKLLGGMLGDRIHDKFRGGELSVQQIKKILKEDVAHLDFNKTYYKWIKKLDMSTLV